MKTFLLILLTPIAFGASILAWIQYKELSELRAKQPVVIEANASLQKNLSTAQNNVKELERQLEDARKPAAPVTAGAVSKPQTPEAAMAGMLPGLAAFMDRPEMQKMMALQQKTAVERRFAALFKKMNLPADQQEKFKALLIEREAASLDTVLSAAQRGMDPMQNPKELQKLISASQTETENQIKETLGETSYSQYQEYRRTEAHRGLVSQLQQNLSFTDTPMTYTQSTQLAQILSETDPRVAASNPGIATNPSPAQTRGTLITEAAIERSRSVLSAPQVQALEELRRQQQANSEARRAMFPGLSNPGQGPAVPAPSQ